MATYYIWGIEPFNTTGDRSVFETKVLKVNSGHALCGPIAFTGNVVEILIVKS